MRVKRGAWRVVWWGAFVLVVFLLSLGSSGAYGAEPERMTAEPAAPNLSTSTIAAWPDLVHVGETVTITIAITNSGGAIAVVRLTDTLPAGLGHVSGTLSASPLPSATLSFDPMLNAVTGQINDLPGAPNGGSVFLTNVATITFATNALLTGTFTNPIQLQDQNRSYEIAPTAITVEPWRSFLPIVTRPPGLASEWITGTYQGLYSICQNGPGITSTLLGQGGFTLSWDDYGGGSSAGLGDPLGNTWDCRSVMVFEFPAGVPHGRVLSGTMNFSNAWTTVQNKNVLPQDVPVGFRQTNWTTASVDADIRDLWFDVRPDTWTQRLPSFQDLCSFTTVSVPSGYLTVSGPEVGIMVYSSAIYRPELWQNDYGRFVNYGHYLTWGGSCPSARPALRLLVQPEVIN